MFYFTTTAATKLIFVFLWPVSQSALGKQHFPQAAATSNNVSAYTVNEFLYACAHTETVVLHARPPCGRVWYNCAH